MQWFRNRRSSFSFDALSFGLLVLLAALLPVFFIPYSAVPFQLSKAYFLLAVVVVTLLVFIFARLKSQTFTWPRSLLFLGLFAPLVAYGVATLVTGASLGVFAQDLLLHDTFLFIACVTALALLAALLVSTPQRLLVLFCGLALGGGVAALFHLVRLFFDSEALSFGGIFAGPAASILGTLSQAALFFGLLGVLAVLALSVLSLSLLGRAMIAVLLVVSLFFLTLVHLSVVWLLLGLVALGAFVAGLVLPLRRREDAFMGRLSVTSLLVLGISVIMLFGGSTISGALADALGVVNIEVRPSFTATLEVGREVFAHDAVFGVGPGLFAEAWDRYKPIEVNATAFWDTRFPSGRGFIPTSFITTGIAGMVAWLVFFVTFFIFGLRLFLLSGTRDSGWQFFQLSAFVGALYLWSIAWFFSLSPVLLALAFLFTGLSFASAGNRESLHVVRFEDNPRLGFIIALLLTVSFLGGLGILFGASQQFVAAALYQKSIAEVNTTGDLAAAEERMARATVLAQSDEFSRFRALLALNELTRLLQNEASTPEEVREQFPLMLSNAVSHGQQAIALDTGDRRNAAVLASIYASVVPLGIEGSYEKAKAAYAQALESAPNNPGLMLASAELERAAGRSEAALALADEALTKKPNYTDAAFFKAQTLAALERTEEAIETVASATLFAQNDPFLFFQLGLLHYSVGNMREAQAAFSRAVESNPQYANARYFLGLVLARQGAFEASLEQFERVLETNPDNTELVAVIESLQRGVSPFGASQTLEAFDSLPVTDEGQIAPPIERVNEAQEGTAGRP